jgi:sulfide:quinone oxidoreductase
MPAKVVILGGGTGGTLAANRLRRTYLGKNVGITVVDVDDNHIYQPGLLFVPFGVKRPEDLVRPRRRQLHSGIDFRQSAIDRVDTFGDRVVLADGTVLPYDVLIVATGSRLMPEETEGLLGEAWNDTVFTFYTLEGATALARRLAQLERGRVAVNIVDMPIKCPVAPLEFSFLADWFFRVRGRRTHVDLSYVTPLGGAFTKPVCSALLRGVMEEKGISIVPDFNTGEIDGPNGQLVSYDGRTVPFDLAVVVPLHGGAEYVGRSDGLGDALNFIPTDEHTLQSRVRPNIFAVGDATDVPTSKAGSVAHFEGQVLVENVRRFLAGLPLLPQYDGHTNCFIETGFEKALLIDFNYDTEPVPGHFPGPVGLPLLKESRLNHIGKLMFEWIYWHALLPGHEMPGIGTTMPTRGKDFTLATTART